MLASLEYMSGQLLLPFGILFFLVWSVIGAGVGVGLMLSGKSMFRMFARMNRYVSTRRELKALALPHDIGQSVHRHRRWIGPVFILGAGYSIYGMGAKFDNASIVSGLALDYPQVVVAWLLESARWVLIVLSIVAIVVGVMLSYSNGALGRIEARLNHWHSARKATLGLDTMHMQPDNLVEAHPRFAGMLIVVASVYVGASAMMQWLLLH
jgi:hypothetical protein